MIYIYIGSGLAILALVLMIIIETQRRTPYGRLSFMTSMILFYYNLTNHPGQTLKPAARREKLATDIRAVNGRLIKIPEITDTFVATREYNIPIRIYTPPNPGSTAVILYFHGGGFMLGSPDVHDNSSRLMAARLNALVIAPDYRLAPEHPFPAATEDAYAVLNWAAEHAPSLGGSRSKIITLGDSAGGNLATITTLMARERKGPQAALQVLLYPWTNIDQLESESFQKFKSGYLLTGDEIFDFRDTYVPDEASRRNPLASPALADDLSGLPPAVVITSQFDVLRDDGAAYAKRLFEAGNHVKYICMEGMIHGFFSMQGCLRKPIYKVLKIIAQAIEQVETTNTANQ